MSKHTDKPQGRDAVKQALIEASIGLFSERGIKAVTIRDIADVANVNSALTYRHFNNKEGLISAAIRTVSLRMEPEKPDTDDSGEQMLMQSFRTIRQHPEVFRVFAHLALEKTGDAFKELQSPYFKETIKKIQQSQTEGQLSDDIDARLLLACSYAMGLGWHIFKPMLIELAGLQKFSQNSAQEIERFWFDLLSKP